MVPNLGKCFQKQSLLDCFIFLSPKMYFTYDMYVSNLKSQKYYEFSNILKNMKKGVHSCPVHKHLKKNSIHVLGKCGCTEFNESSS